MQDYNLVTDFLFQDYLKKPGTRHGLGLWAAINATFELWHSNTHSIPARSEASCAAS